MTDHPQSPTVRDAALSIEKFEPSTTTSNNPHLSRVIRHSSFAWSLWLWVVAGFLFLATLWTIMFFAARAANVQSVPLATQGVKR